MRRVTSARDQVQMLSPWREAAAANGYDLMRDSMFNRLNSEYHAWYKEHGNPRLEAGNNGPLSNWRNIEDFLGANYPAAHRGLNAGLESAGSLLDGRPTGLGRVPDLPAYETGPEAVARHGYDPKEVTATMLLLHNLSHERPTDIWDADVDRLAEIARNRAGMQRAYEQRGRTSRRKTGGERYVHERHLHASMDRVGVIEPNHEIAFYRQERGDLRRGCRRCGAGTGQPCAPDCRAKNEFIADALDYDENVRDIDHPCFRGSCSAQAGEKCAADCSNRSQEKAWKEYETNGNIAYLHDWWLDHNGRNMGSWKATDDFRDWFSGEKWMRSGDERFDHDKHGPSEEDGDLLFDRQMEGSYFGPFDDDYEDEDEDAHEHQDDWDFPEDLDPVKEEPPLSMGQGLAWMIKHQNDVANLDRVPDDDRYDDEDHGAALARYLERHAPRPEYSDPDENLHPDDPRIKGARLAQMSWDEVIKRIDEQLAEGEQEGGSLPLPPRPGLPGWEHSGNPYNDIWFFHHHSGLTGYVEDHGPGGNAFWEVYPGPHSAPVADGGGRALPEGQMGHLDAMREAQDWIERNHHLVDADDDDDWPDAHHGGR